MSAPQGLLGASRLALGWPMCSTQGLRRPGPHRECGPRGQHPGPSNCPPVVAPGRPLHPGRRRQGRHSRARGWRLSLFGPIGGGRGSQGRSLVRKGGAWPLTWGQNAARLASCQTSPACCPRAGFRMPVGCHEVRTRLMIWRRPVLWGGASGPRLIARQAVVRGDPAAGAGGNPGGRPTSSTAGLAPCPCPYAGGPAAPSGKHHLLGQRAHRAVHHGYPGPDHSGTKTSIRHPSRAALVTTSSRRLKGGFTHRSPALG